MSPEGEQIEFPHRNLIYVLTRSTNYTNRETSPSAPSFSSKRMWITISVHLPHQICHLHRHEFYSLIKTSYLGHSQWGLLNKARGHTDAVNRDQHLSLPASPPLVFCHIPSFQTNLLGSARYLLSKCVTNLGRCSSMLGVKMLLLCSEI